MVEWISVKEKFPEIHKAVLGWSTLDNYYVLTVLQPNDNWFCQPLFGVNYYTHTGISHWQELPDKCTLTELSHDG